MISADELRSLFWYKGGAVETGFQESRMSFRRCACILASVLAVYPLLGVAQQSAKSSGFDMTLVRPETVGFSTERLERLHTLMEEAVKDQQVAGVVTILARHGKVVDYRTYGMQNIEKHEAKKKYSIFRDYSMK
jgi:CubicO group peptidase (beta-lactamase class C family)